jgi:hypothetical protein
LSQLKSIHHLYENVHWITLNKILQHLGIDVDIFRLLVTVTNTAYEIREPPEHKHDKIFTFWWGSFNVKRQINGPIQWHLLRMALLIH